VVLFKVLLLWVPAAFFWVSLVTGYPFLDTRTDEEIQDDEHEVRRLERFFGVEGLSEAESFAEWTNKEEALSQIVEKVLRSRHFMDMLVQGPHADIDAASPKPTDYSPWPKAKAARLSAEAEAVEVSYVMPPPAAEEDDDTLDVAGGDAQRRWAPRLVLAHRGGGLALLALAFEHVAARGKDREEHWSCTALQGYLVLAGGGEATCEEICDLHGPVPHGVRYMRI